MNDTIRAAILYALNDENGVSFDTYEAFLHLGNYLPDYGTPIFDRVEATDGRYYLTQEDYDELVEQFL